MLIAGREGRTNPSCQGYYFRFKKMIALIRPNNARRSLINMRNMLFSLSASNGRPGPDPGFPGVKL